MNYSYKISPMMERTTAPKYFNDTVLAGRNQGYIDFAISLEGNMRTYPNICVPISAMIDYYNTKELSFSFQFSPEKADYIQHTSFHNPKEIELFIGSPELNFPLDKVWKFSSSEGVNALATAYINTIRESDQLGQGVLGGIEWCINETMDNVLQHSLAPYGFVMGQLQKESKKLLLCIFDWGIGIYNSLKPSKHNPSTPLDAITMALQERVTRDDQIGQGNGMWGLSQIIKENSGVVRISSCGAVYSYNNNVVKTIESGYVNFGRDQGSTFIDFQLDYSIPINISRALGGNEPLDLWLEDRELNNGEYLITVSELAHGTGTRQSAIKLRNLVLNVYHEKRQKIILDFEGVNVISSSFSDELIGKIISEYGFMFFINSFEVRNVSSTSIGIINRSIEQRMAQKYYDHEIKDTED